MEVKNAHFCLIHTASANLSLIPVEMKTGSLLEDKKLYLGRRGGLELSQSHAFLHDVKMSLQYIFNCLTVLITQMSSLWVPPKFGFTSTIKMGSSPKLNSTHVHHLY